MTTETLPKAYDEVINQTLKTPSLFSIKIMKLKRRFYFMKLKQFHDDMVEYASLHELLDRYYDARGERERVKQRAMI